MTQTIYELPALRALALHTQCLDRANGSEGLASREAINSLVEQLGCVQIDTLQMVHRSHYLVLWSRLGNYAVEELDHLVYDPNERRLFEGWQHAASLIPLNQYRYQLPHMRYLRGLSENRSDGWLAETGNRELVRQVRERIRAEGGLRGADFKYDGPKRGSWWDWKPAKIALEHLYARGELMISNRVNFQRVYDLRERVLPEWVDLSEPSREERDRAWMEHNLKVLGVCDPRQAAGYPYVKRGDSRQVFSELISAGIALPIQGRLANGDGQTLYVHRDNLPALEQASDGALEATRSTFLSPFDNLFWAAGRDKQLWNFHQTLEAYLPDAKRTWGYFCLPILHRDRLVGRFDPKLERASGTLRIKALYLEPEVEPAEDLVSSVAEAMRDFLVFHQANEVIVERSQPEDFGKALVAAL